LMQDRHPSRTRVPETWIFGPARLQHPSVSCVYTSSAARGLYFRTWSLHIVHTHSFDITLVLLIARRASVGTERLRIVGFQEESLFSIEEDVSVVLPCCAQAVVRFLHSPSQCNYPRRA